MSKQTEHKAKRAIDFCLAALSIVVFSPLFLICYLAIKLSGGPVIYKQERIGKGVGVVVVGGPHGRVATKLAARPQLHEVILTQEVD